MEHASLKVVPEPRFPTSVPSTIYNLPRILLSYSYSKRHVLVRRPRMESNHTPIAIGGIGLQRERGPLLFINQIGIENIKRISLNHLRRRVLLVVMRLIVLVPVIPAPNFIKIHRLLRRVFLLPHKRLVRQTDLIAHLLLVLLQRFLHGPLSSITAILHPYAAARSNRTLSASSACSAPCLSLINRHDKASNSRCRTISRSSFSCFRSLSGSRPSRFFTAIADRATGSGLNSLSTASLSGIRLRLDFPAIRSAILSSFYAQNPAQLALLGRSAPSAASAPTAASRGTPPSAAATPRRSNNPRPSPRPTPFAR